MPPKFILAQVEGPSTPMNPIEAVVSETARTMHIAHKRMSPQQAGIFLGSMLTNIASNISPEIMAAFRELKDPCGKPDCICHIPFKLTLEYFEKVRAAEAVLTKDSGAKESPIPEHFRG